MHCNCTTTCTYTMVLVCFIWPPNVVHICHSTNPPCIAVLYFDNENLWLPYVIHVTQPTRCAVCSVYFDNENLELYHGRLDKKPNAIAVRIRWVRLLLFAGAGACMQSTVQQRRHQAL